MAGTGAGGWWSEGRVDARVTTVTMVMTEGA